MSNAQTYSATFPNAEVAINTAREHAFIAGQQEAIDLKHKIEVVIKDSPTFTDCIEQIKTLLKT